MTKQQGQTVLRIVADLDALETATGSRIEKALDLLTEFHYLGVNNSSVSRKVIEAFKRAESRLGIRHEA